jgi:hypothetical protein
MEEGFGGVFPLEQGLKLTVYSLAVHVALSHIKSCAKQGKILRHSRNSAVNSSTNSTEHNPSSIFYLKLASLSNGLCDRYQGFRF